MTASHHARSDNNNKRIRAKDLSVNDVSSFKELHDSSKHLRSLLWSPPPPLREDNLPNHLVTQLIIPYEGLSRAEREDKLLAVLRIVVHHGYFIPSLHALIDRCNNAGSSLPSEFNHSYSSAFRLLCESSFIKKKRAETISRDSSDLSNYESWTHNRNRMLILVDRLSAQSNTWFGLDDDSNLILDETLSFSTNYLIGGKVSKYDEDGDEQNDDYDITGELDGEENDNLPTLKELIEKNSDFRFYGNQIIPIEAEDVEYHYILYRGAQHYFVKGQLMGMFDMYGDFIKVGGNGQLEQIFTLCFSNQRPQELYQRVLAVLDLCELHLRRLGVLILRKLEANYLGIKEKLHASLTPNEADSLSSPTIANELDKLVEALSKVDDHAPSFYNAEQALLGIIIFTDMIAYWSTRLRSGQVLQGGNYGLYDNQLYDIFVALYYAFDHDPHHDFLNEKYYNDSVSHPQIKLLIIIEKYLNPIDQNTLVPQSIWFDLHYPRGAFSLFVGNMKIAVNDYKYCPLLPLVDRMRVIFEVLPESNVNNILLDILHHMEWFMFNALVDLYNPPHSVRVDDTTPHCCILQEVKLLQEAQHNLTANMPVRGLGQCFLLLIRSVEHLTRDTTMVHGFGKVLEQYLHNIGSRCELQLKKQCDGKITNEVLSVVFPRSIKLLVECLSYVDVFASGFNMCWSDRVATKLMKCVALFALELANMVEISNYDSSRTCMISFWIANLTLQQSETQDDFNCCFRMSKCLCALQFILCRMLAPCDVDDRDAHKNWLLSNEDSLNVSRMVIMNYNSFDWAHRFFTQISRGELEWSLYFEVCKRDTETALISSRYELIISKPSIVCDCHWASMLKEISGRLSTLQALFGAFDLSGQSYLLLNTLKLRIALYLADCIRILTGLIVDGRSSGSESTSQDDRVTLLYNMFVVIERLSKNVVIVSSTIQICTSDDHMDMTDRVLKESIETVDKLLIREHFASIRGCYRLNCEANENHFEGSTLLGNLERYPLDHLISVEDDLWSLVLEECPSLLQDSGMQPLTCQLMTIGHHLFQQREFVNWFWYNRIVETSKTQKQRRYNNCAGLLVSEVFAELLREVIRFVVAVNHITNPSDRARNLLTLQSCLSSFIPPLWSIATNANILVDCKGYGNFPTLINSLGRDRLNSDEECYRDHMIVNHMLTPMIAHFRLLRVVVTLGDRERIFHIPDSSQRLVFDNHNERAAFRDDVYYFSSYHFRSFPFKSDMNMPRKLYPESEWFVKYKQYQNTAQPYQIKRALLKVHERHHIDRSGLHLQQNQLNRKLKTIMNAFDGDFESLMLYTTLLMQLMPWELSPQCDTEYVKDNLKYNQIAHYEENVLRKEGYEYCLYPYQNRFLWINAIRAIQSTSLIGTMTILQDTLAGITQRIRDSFLIKPFKYFSKQVLKEFVQACDGKYHGYYHDTDVHSFKLILSDRFRNAMGSQDSCLELTVEQAHDDVLQWKKILLLVMPHLSSKSLPWKILAQSDESVDLTSDVIWQQALELLCMLQLGIMLHDCLLKLRQHYQLLIELVDELKLKQTQYCKDDFHSQIDQDFNVSCDIKQQWLESQETLEYALPAQLLIVIIRYQLSILTSLELDKIVVSSLDSASLNELLFRFIEIHKSFMKCLTKDMVVSAVNRLYNICVKNSCMVVDNQQEILEIWEYLVSVESLKFRREKVDVLLFNYVYN